MTDIQKNYQKYHSHISSKHKWFDLKLKEVWNYKDLIWLFTKRSFVVYLCICFWWYCRNGNR